MRAGNSENVFPRSFNVRLSSEEKGYSAGGARIVDRGARIFPLPSARPEQIAAIGISAAMVGAWLVDAIGKALRPGINWEDSRTQDMLDRRLDADPDFYRRVFQADGCVMQ